MIELHHISRSYNLSIGAIRAVIHKDCLSRSGYAQVVSFYNSMYGETVAHTYCPAPQQSVTTTIPTLKLSRRLGSFARAIFRPVGYGLVNLGHPGRGKPKLEVLLSASCSSLRCIGTVR
jgi:hypothetical protein